MKREEALHRFWSSFGVPAYDEATVPENAGLPRINYNVTVDSFDRPVSLTASLYSRSKSWVQVTELQDLIWDTIGDGGAYVPYDGGAMWIKPRMPFASRMGDPDDSIRHIVLNLEAEFV